MQSSTGIDVDHHAQPCVFVPVRMSTVPNLALPPLKKRPSDMQPPKHVWLTLDDGPDPVHSERILRVLDHHGIKAVFFVIGNRVAAHAATLRRTFEAGHLVANHTLTHRRLTELSDAEVLREIETTDQLIAEHGGGQKWLRPPFGACDDRVVRLARKLGHRTVLWDVDPNDWDPRHQPKAWIDRALREMRHKADCVILAHDDRPTTAEHFDLFLRRLKGSGKVVFQDPATLEQAGAAFARIAGPP
ncbi:MULTISPECIES: polysaccharide deacetylase family protein [unclassified Mesorhizobium]|uniref:polysaccharide deacetylase family protein n=1 Tax=unclassified Mesorhizobium TaxID=325217 RepID=UPI001ACEBC65|nr:MULTISPECIES: polysaccharide deacetylase family protein [unclassified Mesorhizobium]MBN9254667.1 polysaccharide deacetylase family protein [Mesorhizobium sp.]